MIDSHKLFGTMRIGTLLPLLLAVVLSRNVFAGGPQDTSYSKLPLLVIGESEAQLEKYNGVLSSLREKGFVLTISSQSDDDLAVRSEGENIYSGVLFLCPKCKIPSLPVSKLTTFLDNGGSLFVAAAASTSFYIREVAAALGVDVSPSGILTDHARPSKLDDGNHTFITGGYRPASPYLLGNTDPSQISFRGACATLFIDNELVDGALTASGSSYCGYGKPARKPNRHAGAANIMAATLSTRKRSRGVYFGSIEALSDETAAAAGEVHARALRTLVAWTFGHNGMLRVGKARHRLENGEEREYRVKDRIEFEIDVERWDGNVDKWVPFEGNDMQLEFTMLNPWVRTRLKNDGRGTLSAVFNVPDQIGVYKFVIEYHRAGLSGISFAEIVPVRPFLHNEYPRFLPQAYPYYATAFSMLAGVLLLGLVLLFGGVQPEDGQKRKGVQSTAVIDDSPVRSTSARKRKAN